MLQHTKDTLYRPQRLPADVNPGLKILRFYKILRLKKMVYRVYLFHCTFVLIYK